MAIKEFVQVIANIQEVSYEEAVEFAVQFIEEHPAINRELLKGVVYEKV